MTPAAGPLTWMCGQRRSLSQTCTFDLSVIIFGRMSWALDQAGVTRTSAGPLYLHRALATWTGRGIKHRFRSVLLLPSRAQSLVSRFIGV